ncbi:hypothetical protein EI53_01281 [Fusobacterium naviforme]|nr:hypothetical protein F7P78_06400 [Fusobacterium naviforme]PSL10219.1 hypothetical protein EI53_01281 [Fusobacterium naviforme]STO27629.1 Uncharacterised protein [Fusobacterium naviforme]
MKENPELPVIPMVDKEDVLKDMVGCEYYRTRDGRDITELSDEEWDELYAAIPWIPCITVNITT